MCEEKKSTPVPLVFFAHTINKLKGKVTMLFITHQLPKALQVDEVINFGMPEAGAEYR